MKIHLSPDPVALGEKAGARAAAVLRAAVEEKGAARLVLATGASQFATLDQLVSEEGIAWDRVTFFHLDEYLGLPEDHPASFRRYLRERFVDRVPPLAAMHFIRGDAPDPEAECDRLNGLIREKTIDLALIGIGENGHLAFNDPPADFEAKQPFHLVELDRACRQQQLGEGWFASLEAVPQGAISMSVPQILRARHLICSVPDARKADAVYCALREPISPQCPASILRQHSACDLYLDKASAARL
jgi:glucosamine-6-phosphate deaminase